VCEPIELSFGMVSGVSPDIGVLDKGSRDPREREVLWDLSPNCLNSVFESIFKTELHSSRS